MPGGSTANTQSSGQSVSGQQGSVTEITPGSLHPKLANTERDEEVQGEKGQNQRIKDGKPFSDGKVAPSRVVPTKEELDALITGVKGIGGTDRVVGNTVIGSGPMSPPTTPPASNPSSPGAQERKLLSASKLTSRPTYQPVHIVAHSSTSVSESDSSKATQAARQILSRDELARSRRKSSGSADSDGSTEGALPSQMKTMARGQHLMPPTPNATPSTICSTDALEVEHDPAQSSLTFMQSVFPTFSIEKVNRRLRAKTGAASTHPSGENQQSVTLEDAGVELVCPDWKGAVIVAKVCEPLGGTSSEEEELTEVEEEPLTIRTLYLSLPPSVTQLKTHGAQGSSRLSSPPLAMQYGSASSPLSPPNNDATLPTHLRESLLSVLDHASEKLECEKVVICVERETKDFKSLLHGLCYVGGQIVSYGPAKSGSRKDNAVAISGGLTPSRTSSLGGFSPFTASSLGRSSSLSKSASRTSKPESEADADADDVEVATLVGGSSASESENEFSTMGLVGVQGLLPRQGLVLVAVDL